MSLTDRVFGAFENELSRHLAFSFTLIRRIDSSGTPSTRMKVWMRNNSSVNLSDLSRFRFRDTARSLTHVATAIPLSDDSRSSSRRPSPPSRGPQSLEVSWGRGSAKKPA